MKTFVCDVDGVLADFVRGFTELAHSVYPSAPVYGTHQQKTWHTFPGLTAEQVLDVWRRIGDSPTFWETLSPLVSEKNIDSLKYVNLYANLYFVTSRSGNDPLHQTKQWLSNTLGIYSPNVIVSNRKADVCKGVEALGAIDDKADNVTDIAAQAAWYGGRTKPFLLSRPYNIYDEGNIGSKRIVRVGGLQEYLDWCVQQIQAS